MSISLAAYVLTAVFIRAMIPVGFMPAPLGGEAMSALTFCVNGLSNQNIVFLHLAQSSPQDDDSHAVHDCLFGTSHNKAFVSPGAFFLVLALHYFCSRVRSAKKGTLAWNRLLGPPIGARAPPVD